MHNKKVLSKEGANISVILRMVKATYIPPSLILEFLERVGLACSLLTHGNCFLLKGERGGREADPPKVWFYLHSFCVIGVGLKGVVSHHASSAWGSAEFSPCLWL